MIDFLEKKSDLEKQISLTTNLTLENKKVYLQYEARIPSLFHIKFIKILKLYILLLQI